MSDVKVLQYLCIQCPIGCHLEVEEDESGNIVEVRGFDCKRGEKYAAQEHTDPRRMVTTTIRISGGTWAKLPVRTSESVPKGQVADVCKLLRKIEVTAPVKTGDVIVNNVLDTGVDIIASRDM